LLGWNFRKYKGKLIVKPSKNSIQTVIGKFSETILKRGKAWEQEVLIMKLNQQIRGWT
ncbi:group II intron reverse transcriptase/maturase, partial [Streptococcus canis]